MQHRWGAHLPYIGFWDCRWTDHWVCDAWPVRRQTYGYLPSRRASPPLGRYQIILPGERGTWVWTTCPDPELLPSNAPAGSRTCDLSITSPTPLPVHYRQNSGPFYLCLQTSVNQSLHVHEWLQFSIWQNLVAFQRYRQSSSTRKPSWRKGYTWECRHSKMAVSRHLLFYRTGNSTIRSADPKKPRLESNMEWIGCIICEIFTFKLYCYLETGIRGHSRSLKVTLFDRVHMTLY